MSTRDLRVGAAAALALALGIALPMATAAPAQAAQFRYWGYWLALPGASDWTFSALGPAFRPAVDGSVEGWRFAVTGVAADAPPGARPGTAFRETCRDTPAVDGSIRVAVIIDPGAEADAPAGDTPGELSAHCVVLPEGATGMEALTAAADLRIERGLVCGISGYPMVGCVEPVVDEAQPTSTPTPTPTFTPTPTPSPTPPAPASVPPSPLPTPSMSPAPSDSTSPRAAPAAPVTAPGTGPWPLIAAGLVGLVVAAYALIRRRTR